jgi:hypothetical protein
MQYGIVYIATREALIWMKRLRNSKQDIADIEALENVKNEKVIRDINNLQDFCRRTRLLRSRIKTISSTQSKKAEQMETLDEK